MLVYGTFSGLQMLEGNKIWNLLRSMSQKKRKEEQVNEREWDFIFQFPPLGLSFSFPDTFSHKYTQCCLFHSAQMRPLLPAVSLLQPRVLPAPLKAPCNLGVVRVIQPPQDDEDSEHRFLGYIWPHSMLEKVITFLH